MELFIQIYVAPHARLTHHSSLLYAQAQPNERESFKSSSLK